MGKTIVFFNLADKDEHGLAETAVDALHKKHPKHSFIYECFVGANKIYQINLFDLLDYQRNPKRYYRELKEKNSDSEQFHGMSSNAPEIPINMFTGHVQMLPAIHREIVTVHMLCRQADKIMLGIHGHFDDTEKCFSSMGWEQGSSSIGNYHEIAKLIAQFMLPGRAYKLALIVCFGARSENYRKDHDGKLTYHDIKSSFAYKFFKQLCLKSQAKIIMTARTGAVGFNAQTGRSEVQTEAAVHAEIENAELQAARETKLIADQYRKIQDEMCSNSKDRDIFFAIEEKISLNINNIELSSLSGLEKTIVNYLKIKDKVNNLMSDANGVQNKYGKFIYDYDPIEKIITVTRKYINQKKINKLLYQGQL